MAGDELVQARRVLYRVRLLVPESLGEPAPGVPRPAAELELDVSADRLRARFVGAGWPVAPGSEVRLRGDQPGAYVFDGNGGRPLGPGQFAAWFNGGPLDHRRPSIRIVMPALEEQIGPGNLVCRLVAEWSNQSTDEVVTRCGPGGTPRLFRVGPWLAERTADVAVRRSRRALRADHESPPEPVEARSSHAFFTRAMLARIEGRPPPRVQPRDLPPPPDEGILVRNDGPCRNLVVVNGVPIGYVDADSTGHFRAVTPGIYRIGAMRPLGWVTLGADPVIVPGALRLPR